MSAQIPQHDASNKLPQPEGTQNIELPSGAGSLSFVGERPLSEMAVDHVFFTHGLFFALGLLDQDPLARAWEAEGLPMSRRPGIFVSDTPLFLGLPPMRAEWSRRLLVVHQEYWPFVETVLRATSNVSWPLKRLWTAAELHVDIPDPLYHFAHPTANHCPRVPITVFTVNGNWAVYGLRTLEGAAAGVTHFRVISGPPDPSVVSVAKKLFDEESHTPFRAIEPTRYPDDMPVLKLPDNLR